MIDSRLKEYRVIVAWQPIFQAKTKSMKRSFYPDLVLQVLTLEKEMYLKSPSPSLLATIMRWQLEVPIELRNGIKSLASGQGYRQGILRPDAIANQPKSP